MKITMALPEEKRFGVTDYWRMYKAKGIRLPLNYFLQAHFFDLLHGTDTHTWLPKEVYQDTPKNLDHGTFYMCSWTKEIMIAFDVLREKLGSEFENYCFVDIGCGKGKVIILWAMLLKKFGLRQRLTGVDYYAPFINVAKKNQRISGIFDECLFVYADATEIDYQKLGSKLILYLYNPFDQVILRKILSRVSEVKAIIVYNHPVHENEIRSAGYKVVWEKRGWHPNSQTIILRKPED